MKNPSLFFSNLVKFVLFLIKINPNLPSSAPAARLFGYLSRKGRKGAKDAKEREEEGKKVL